MLFISTVLTHNIKQHQLVFNPKRFNVAISRGKGLCVIVGNPRYLAESKYWSAAVDYCLNAGAKVLLIEKASVPGGISICSYGAVRSASDPDAPSSSASAAVASQQAADFHQ